ncbi:MAG: hypothetical protein AAFP09_03955, partial [Cyanobacteria bacterium J06607_10]
ESLDLNAPDERISLERLPRQSDLIGISSNVFAMAPRDACHQAFVGRKKLSSSFLLTTPSSGIL